ncbi:ISAzo13-like element transposase-related protein, partial [Noviherbaspirillum aerium]
MTVAKLLHKFEFSPKANARRTEARGASPKERNAQFEHIDEQRSQFKATGAPIISVDTKKIYGHPP